MEGVRKIAVLRANAIGDFLFALPAIEALRARYPVAEIVLLARAWHRDFLAGRPGPVDRVEVVPPYPGVGLDPDAKGDEAACAAFFRRMEAERFDVALQLHGGGRFSNPFVKRLGARRTVGLKAPDAEPLDESVPYHYYQPEVLRYLEVAALLDAPPLLLEPRIVVTERDRREAAPFVPGRPLAVLHPGASDTRRRWEPARFAAVGDALSRAGAAVAITGTPDERATVDRVRESMQEPALDLCGRLSLCGVTGLLAASRVVISNDTGPLHLAVAVGAATVGIFWCGNLINAGPFGRRRHRPALSWVIRCPVCGTDCTAGRCEHRPSFVDGVTAEEVIGSALDLLRGD